MSLQAGKSLPAEALYRRCDPGQLTFDTTESLEKFSEVPGQERAVEAIHFATEIDVGGYNVFVLGPTGAGRHTFVRQFLESKAAAREVPSDWCYVYNFDDPRQPKALRLPAGVGKDLRVDLEHAIQDAQTVIPAAFESEDFQAQQEALTEEFKEKQEKAFKTVESEAKERGIGVIQTPTGIAFIPLMDGEAMKPPEFEKLPKEQQKKIHRDVEELTQRLQRVMRATPKHARELRQAMRQLEHDVAGLAVTGLVDELKQKYRHIPEVVDHLERMQADIVDNVGLFLSPQDGPGVPAQMKQMMHAKESSAIRRYAISVLVDRSDCTGAPVVFEDIVYCSAGYGVGAGAFKISKKGSKLAATQIWRRENECFNHWSTPVVKDGFLYGMFSFKEYGEGPLACVDIRTGQDKWKEGGFGPGQVILAGDKIIATSDKGEIVVAEAQQEKYQEVKRKDVLDGKVWSYPILANGKIFARSTVEGVCLDLN